MTGPVSRSPSPAHNQQCGLSEFQEEFALRVIPISIDESKVPTPEETQQDQPLVPIDDPFSNAVEYAPTSQEDWTKLSEEIKELSEVLSQQGQQLQAAQLQAALQLPLPSTDVEEEDMDDASTIQASLDSLRAQSSQPEVPEVKEESITKAPEETPANSDQPAAASADVVAKNNVELIQVDLAKKNAEAPKNSGNKRSIWKRGFSFIAAPFYAFARLIKSFLALFHRV